MVNPEVFHKAFVSTENNRQYFIDRKLQNVLDSCVGQGNAFSLSRYIFVLGTAGKDPLSDDRPRINVVDRISEDVASHDVDTVVEESLRLEKVQSLFDGKRVFNHLIKVRDECIIEYGKDKIELVEQAVGVDSVGIYMGDSRPLLGLDLDKVNVAWHYLMFRRQSPRVL